MNPVLKEMFIEAINAEPALAKGNFFNEETGRLCAIGVLYNVTGAWDQNSFGASTDVYHFIHKQVEGIYSIVRVNDACSRPCNRKRSVIKFIKENF